MALCARARGSTARVGDPAHGPVAGSVGRDRGRFALMPSPPEAPWRVVLRGRMSAEMVDRLRAAGIVPCGAPSASGKFDRGGKPLIDHPLLVVARDADDAYVHVGEALGDHFAGGIMETPQPWGDEQRSAVPARPPTRR